MSKKQERAFTWIGASNQAISLQYIINQHGGVINQLIDRIDQLEGKTEAPADNVLDGIRMCQRTLLTLCSRFDKLEEAKARPVAESDEQICVEREDLQRLNTYIYYHLHHGAISCPSRCTDCVARCEAQKIFKKYGV